MAELKVGPDDLKKGNQRATATTGKAATPMPWELYEGLAETLEILSDTQLVEALNASLEREAKRKHPA